mmetsp:Transcript_13915/g.35955  ORF Transcript_13915/g.35955 Transcript_13915/m.35955 type:complete len:271 (-) Transcript_13915:698-1510(-)
MHLGLDAPALGGLRNLLLQDRRAVPVKVDLVPLQHLGVDILDEGLLPLAVRDPGHVQQRILLLVVPALGESLVRAWAGRLDEGAVIDDGVEVKDFVVHEPLHVSDWKVHQQSCLLRPFVAEQLPQVRELLLAPVSTRAELRGATRLLRRVHAPGADDEDRVRAVGLEVSGAALATALWIVAVEAGVAGLAVDDDLGPGELAEVARQVGAPVVRARLAQPAAAERDEYDRPQRRAGVHQRLAPHVRILARRRAPAAARGARCHGEGRPRTV